MILTELADIICDGQTVEVIARRKRNKTLFYGRAHRTHNPFHSVLLDSEGFQPEQELCERTVYKIMSYEDRILVFVY